MKTLRKSSASGGYAMLMVMVTTAVGLTVASAYLKWSSTKESLSERAKEYTGKMDVAEASTEMFYSYLSKDFLLEGKEKVDQNIWKYSSWYTARALDLTGSTLGKAVSRATQTLDPIAETFTQDLKNNTWTFGSKITNWTYMPLPLSPDGLYGEVATFRVYSYGRKTGNSYQLVQNVVQDVQCASVPIFQFGVFYSDDLEMSPEDDINDGQVVNGRVHSNADMYLRPSGKTLTFAGPVTASGSIQNIFHPDDPRTGTPTKKVAFESEKLTRAKSLYFPVGENPPPNAGHELIDPPPALENKTSVMGRLRMFNKADLIMEILPGNVVSARSGAYNNFSTIIPQSKIKDIIGFKSFFNRREYRFVESIDFDMEEFLDAYSTLKSILGRDIQVLYISDLRVHAYMFQSGVRLINGEVLPEKGLTIATPNPLYVYGDYNVGETQGRGRRAKVVSPPVNAALIADALTVLSGNWSDSDSTKGLNKRRASSTVVNAAIIAGIVPSGGGYYSGGMENLVRLLEDWDRRDLVVSGSFVVLYKSETATGPWGTYNVYNTPRRRYSFDSKFLNPNNLPPGTPELRTVIRNPWIES